MNDERRAAFEALWREEYARVFRTAFLVTGDRQEAADVTQEAFARAYERWRVVARAERPGAWVQRVAVNLALTWRRRQRLRSREAAVAPQAVVEPPDLPDPDLFAALKALPPQQRAAVVLRHWTDLSIEETARTLGKRPGTVKALTSQGLANLRKTLATTEENAKP
ncbi:MAG TPA: SigE family RNA polymerase sigma factor [Actinomycetota bacterium]|nr:SigE family RNA polymerase sigma factor [Actinomycetota bacterium]